MPTRVITAAATSLPGFFEAITKNTPSMNASTPTTDKISFMLLA